jgi:hypothetical protein
MTSQNIDLSSWDSLYKTSDRRSAHYSLSLSLSLTLCKLHKFDRDVHPTSCPRTCESLPLRPLYAFVTCVRGKFYAGVMYKGDYEWKTGKDIEEIGLSCVHAFPPELALRCRRKWQKHLRKNIQAMGRESERRSEEMLKSQPRIWLLSNVISFNTFKGLWGMEKLLYLI